MLITDVLAVACAPAAPVSPAAPAAPAKPAAAQTGQVQLATLLTPEAAKQLPGSLTELTGEAVGIRINPEHPVLLDVRVRQAINPALDRKSMLDVLYGGVAEPLNGMMVRKSSLGWNPNLKEYPYDPARATQLVQEADAVGQSITLISRTGMVPRVDEVTELFANFIHGISPKLHWGKYPRYDLIRDFTEWTLDD